MCNCPKLFYGVLRALYNYLKFILLKSKIHEIQELRLLPPTGKGRGVDRKHLGSKSSMEYRVYFEMFFLNSKFHEIHELGAIFTYGGRGGGNELHLGYKLFREESRILSTLKCSS